MAVSARPLLDLLDGDSYVRDTYARYAWFREHEPVAWDGINELWGVFRYDDVLEIEKNKQVFISSDRLKGGYRRTCRLTRRSSASTTRCMSSGATWSVAGSRPERCSPSSPMSGRSPSS